MSETKFALILSIRDNYRAVIYRIVYEKMQREKCSSRNFLHRET